MGAFRCLGAAIRIPILLRATQSGLIQSSSWRGVRWRRNVARPGPISPLARTLLHPSRNSRSGHCLNGFQVQFEGIAKEAQAEWLAGLWSGEKAFRFCADAFTR